MPAASLIPRKTPASGYGCAAALMLLAVLGLMLWKSSRDRAEPTVIEITQPLARASAPMLAEPPPPPPPPAPPLHSPALQPSRQRVPTAASSASGPCGDCAGSADGALQGALQGQARRATGCYERALRMTPGLRGRVVLGVKVGRDGQVCSARVSDSTLKDPSVTACVLQMFQSGVFPPPKGGCVEVEVPINFVPRT